MSIFSKIKSALFKTSSYLGSRLLALFKSPLTDEAYEKLEQLLYAADLGSKVTAGCIQDVKKFLTSRPKASPEEIIERMELYAQTILSAPSKVHMAEGQPHVILIVGVNGSGKTTSIAKLAALYQQEGKKVIAAAADTFRAGAIQQLSLWCDKVGVELVKSQAGSDPSSVVFDALVAATKRNKDLVLVDTAGRLQNKTDLMQELEKVRRVCAKVVPGAPHEILLVLDATTGQNGLEQAKIFHQFTPLTGIILTKLDGTAKGGIALPIYQELGIPIKWVGVGEGATDLVPFDPKTYVAGLFNASFG